MAILVNGIKVAGLGAGVASGGTTGQVLSKKSNADYDTEWTDINLDAIEAVVEEHAGNTEIHITQAERDSWFSGDYNDLANKPCILEDGSGSLNVADQEGNVILKVDENGLETTSIAVKNITVDGVDVVTTIDNNKLALDTHVNNASIHITDAERTAWSAKADKTYVDQKVADLVNSAPDTLNTLDELAAALGDDANFATTVTNQIASKVDKTTFDSHSHNKADIGLGNVDNTSDANKPVSTAQQQALNALKSELSESIVSESKEWTVADVNGNIIAKVDASGLETTAVIAKSVVVNGTDVKTALDNKADKDHTHEYLEASDIADFTTKNYVDEGLANAIAAAKEDSANKDAVVLAEVQNGIDAIQTELVKKADSDSVYSKTDADDKFVAKADVATTLEPYAQTSDVDAKLANKADSANVYTKAETYTREEISAKIEEITGGESAGDVLSKLNEYISKIESGETVVAKATHAVNADSATSAETATNANYAVSADSAAEATHATSADTATAADSATKATQDASGNEITATYETKTDAAAKLAEAKGYADTVASGKANATHPHAISDVTGLQDALNGKALSDHTHDYLVLDDIACKADKSYVDEQIEAAKTDASNQDAVVLMEVQNSIADSIADVKTYVNQEIAKAQLDEKEVDLTAYYTKTETDNKISAAIDAIEHPTVDLTPYATNEYVNAQLETKADTSHTHNEYLTEHQSIAHLAEKTYVDTELAKKVDSAEISHSTETVDEGVSIVNGKLSIVVDAYTKAQTLDAIQDKITEINSNVGESAGAVLSALNDYKKTNDERVGIVEARAGEIEAKNTAQDDAITQIQTDIQSINDNKVNKSYVDAAIEEAKEESSNKDAVILAETQRCIGEVQASITSVGRDVAKIVSGDSTVAKATHADSATSSENATHAASADIAIKAERDENGNVIADTYASKEEAQQAIIGINAKIDAIHSHDNLDVLDGIKASDVKYWNEKSDFSGFYSELKGAPNITEDNSGDLVIADDKGNIIFRSNGAGFETTTLTANNVVVGGKDVAVALAEKANASDLHDHDNKAVLDKITNDKVAAWDGKADKTYVDTELDKKSNEGHEHTQYLEASDIAGKANMSDLHEHDNKAELDKIQSGKVESWDAKVDKAYVDEQIQNHDHDDYLTSILAEYITETELNQKGYLDASSLNDYAKKSEIPAVVDNLVSTSKTDALSAAQGAALKMAIDSITGDIGDLGGGDMMKAAYDTNNNGVVDDSERLEGHAADYFAIAEHTHEELLDYNSVDFNITDKNYRVIFKVDADGTHTTTVNASKLILNGNDISAKIAGIDGILAGMTAITNEEIDAICTF